MAVKQRDALHSVYGMQVYFSPKNGSGLQSSDLVAEFVSKAAAQMNTEGKQTVRVPALQTLFHVGQYVRTSVTGLEQTTAGKTLIVRDGVAAGQFSAEDCANLYYSLTPPSLENRASCLACSVLLAGRVTLHFSFPLPEIPRPCICIKNYIAATK